MKIVRLLECALLSTTTMALEHVQGGVRLPRPALAAAVEDMLTTLAGRRGAGGWLV